MIPFWDILRKESLLSLRIFSNPLDCEEFLLWSLECEHTPNCNLVLDSRSLEVETKCWSHEHPESVEKFFQAFLNCESLTLYGISQGFDTSLNTPYWRFHFNTGNSKVRLPDLYFD